MSRRERRSDCANNSGIDAITTATDSRLINAA
jgi:hypothetical protein